MAKNKLIPIVAAAAFNCSDFGPSGNMCPANTSKNFSPTAMFWSATFLLNYFHQGFFAGGGYNAHLWSLCVEMQFYVAIAAVVFMAGRKGLWIVWPLCIMITMIRVRDGAYISIFTHQRVDEILAGACLATLYMRFGKTRWRLSVMPVILVVVIGGTMIAWFCSASPLTGWIQYLRPYATVAFFASILCFQDTRVGAILACTPLRYIAAISYALYVVHPATVHGWWNEGTSIERYLIKRPLSFAMTFLAAHISTFHWELRWQLAAKRWIYRTRLRREARGFNKTSPV